MIFSKSRAGFTLIELLVVIGILAVLAAIAIPSVAGLIDRANKSSDTTNANEMTNAIERFTSEYELVKQDIASGTFNEDDLDSVQGRVFNTFSISERRQIMHLETDDGFNSYGLNNKSNYPVNEKTVKKVITNYIKTSSTTFIPKQSDCSYFYSPELGRVIIAETGTASVDLNTIAQLEENTAVAGVPEGETVQWIDISMNERLIASGMPITNENVALDKNTYTILRQDVLGYMEFESLSGGLFVEGTDTYIKIDVNGEKVDATWLNLIKGNYLQITNGGLANGPKASQMTGEIVIPKEISSVLDQAWDSGNAFLENSGVTSVILEEGVTRIGNNSFRGTSVQKIHIPSTVSYIGVNLFYNNKQPLKTITIHPDNPYFTVDDGVLYTIDHRELIKYPSLREGSSYTLHENTKKIRKAAFANITQPLAITFNDALTTVEAQAFDYSPGITSVYINKNCNSIGWAAFRTCRGATFTIDSANTSYKVYDNAIYTYDGETVIAVGNQTDNVLTIAKGTKTINCIYTNIFDTLIIPKSITLIGASSMTPNVKNIWYEGTEAEFQNIEIGTDNTTNVTLNTVTSAQKTFNYSY